MSHNIINSEKNGLRSKRASLSACLNFGLYSEIEFVLNETLTFQSVCVVKFQFDQIQSGLNELKIFNQDSFFSSWSILWNGVYIWVLYLKASYFLCVCVCKNRAHKSSTEEKIN